MTCGSGVVDPAGQWGVGEIVGGCWWKQADNVLSAVDYLRHYFKESERYFLLKNEEKEKGIFGLRPLQFFKF